MFCRQIPSILTVENNHLMNKIKSKVLAKKSCHANDLSHRSKFPDSNKNVQTQIKARLN